MLASITEGVPDALRQLQGQAFLAEFKYDGIRAQASPPTVYSLKSGSRPGELFLLRMLPCAVGSHTARVTCRLTSSRAPASDGACACAWAQVGQW